MEEGYLDFDGYKMPENIDEIFPQVFQKTEELPMRAKNAVQMFLKEHGNSVSEMMTAIRNPYFSVGQMKHVGQTTVPVIERFFAEIQEYISGFNTVEDVERAVAEFTAPKLADLPISEKYHIGILALQDRLGYFPVFASVSAFLKSLDESSSVIADGCVRIHLGQCIANHRDVAQSLNLSNERVRQKKNELIGKLYDFFTMIGRSGFVDKSPYAYLTERTEEYVNSTEGTDFTANFVRWVLSGVFDEVTMIGDIYCALTRFYHDDIMVSIVPTDLCPSFDFSNFVSALEAKLAERRIDEEKLLFREFIAPFYKIEASESLSENVELVCRSILFQSYPVDVDEEYIVFRPNSRKNNPAIIEDILRQTGRTMTLDEIFAEFVRLYPDRKISAEAFRGNIGNNRNIVPLGRSSTYALAEWKSGNQRGGTIRMFVDECLNSSLQQIVPITELGEYVRRFRPNTTNEGILANLSLESTHKYAVYVRENIRYVGYRNCDYDSSFGLSDSKRPAKRSLEESLVLLAEFIDSHGRLPRNSAETPEELRLYRFLGLMKSRYGRGQLEGRILERWKDFSGKYLSKTQEPFQGMLFDFS